MARGGKPVTGSSESPMPWRARTPVRRDPDRCSPPTRGKSATTSWIPGCCAALLFLSGCAGGGSPMGAPPPPPSPPGVTESVEPQDEFHPLAVISYSVVGDSIAGDPELETLVAPFRDRMGEEIRQVIGEATVPLACRAICRGKPLAASASIQEIFLNVGDHASIPATRRRVSTRPTSLTHHRFGWAPRRNADRVGGSTRVLRANLRTTVRTGGLCWEPLKR